MNRNARSSSELSVKSKSLKLRISDAMQQSSDCYDNLRSRVITNHTIAVVEVDLLADAPEKANNQ